MDGRMNQTKHWMFFNSRRFSTEGPLIGNSPQANGILSASNSSNNDLSWEERAFAEDSAGNLWGCTWPPRSYSCSFCRREFRSAQALGGHMNVHRRDRAMLRQSPIENSEKIEHHGYFNSVVASPLSPRVSVASSAHQASHEFLLVSPDYSLAVTQKAEKYLHTRVFMDQKPAEISLPDLKLGGESSKSSKMGLLVTRGQLGGRDGEEIISNKRQRTDMTFFSRNSSSTAHDQHPEVLKLSPSPVEELDLELRLGCCAKVQKNCKIVAIE